MRVAVLVFLAGLAGTDASAQGTRAAWQAIDPTAADALHGFRQSNHWIAEAMAINTDDDNRLGRNQNPGEPSNFDAARHLIYIVRDLNGDGQPEVFLQFEWLPVHGNTTQGEGGAPWPRNRIAWSASLRATRYPAVWDSHGNRPRLWRAREQSPRACAMTWRLR